MKRESFPPLTDQQVTACTLYLSRKARGMTLEDIAREVNIDRRTLFKWRQLPQWQEFCKTHAVDIARERMDEVLTVLVNKAMSGHPKALEMYLRMCGLIGENAVQIETHVNTDDRSNSAIEAELNELRQMLEADDENLN